MIQIPVDVHSFRRKLNQQETELHNVKKTLPHCLSIFLKTEDFVQKQTRRDGYLGSSDKEVSDPF